MTRLQKCTIQKIEDICSLYWRKGNLIGEMVQRQHITLEFGQLQWLPVVSEMQYKVLILVFKTLKMVWYQINENITSSHVNMLEYQNLLKRPSCSRWPGHLKCSKLLPGSRLFRVWHKNS